MFRSLTHEFIKRRHELHSDPGDHSTTTKSEWINKLIYISANLREIKLSQSLGTKSFSDPQVFARYEEYMSIEPPINSLRELEVYRSSRIFLQQQLEELRDGNKSFDQKYLKYASSLDDDQITRRLKQLREYSDEMFSQIQIQGNVLNRIDSDLSRILQVGVKSQINMETKVRDESSSWSRSLTWYLIAGNLTASSLHLSKWAFWAIIGLF